MVVNEKQNRKRKKKEPRRFLQPSSIASYAGASSAYDTAKRRAVSQILDQVFHTTKMATQELLLLRRGQRHDPVAVGTLAAVPTVDTIGANKLRGAALEDGFPLVSAGRRGCFGHEIEVEEFDKLELDLTRGGSRFEERRNGHEAVKSFKSSGVVGSIDESDDESQQGSGLDRRAVVRFEEI